MTSNPGHSAMEANGPDTTEARKAPPVLAIACGGPAIRPANLRPGYSEAQETHPKKKRVRYRTRDLVVQFALELAPKQGIQSRRELTPEEWAIVRPRTCRIMDHLLAAQRGGGT